MYKGHHIPCSQIRNRYMSDKNHSLISRLSLPILTDLIFFLGPCLMLAVAISGRGFPESVNAGTLTGFTFLWLAILVLIYKYTLVEGLARYTLAKGEHIFDGMHGFPGPENWEVFFMVLIYVLEMMGYGGLALFSGLFLQELVPTPFTREIMATVTLIIILPLLIRKNFSVFEKIVLFFAVVMICGVIYTFLGITIPVGAMTTGLIPLFSREEVVEIIPIMGAVGSGLNLLLFSIWLREKIGLRHGASFYAEQIRNVRITQGIAFLITGLMTLAFFTIGYFTKGGGDLFTGAIQGLNTLPYGAAVFFFTGYVILFGVLMTGADGRARAVSSILCSTGISKMTETRTYQILILGFIGLMLFIVWSGNPKTLLSYTSAFGSFMFAFVGVMMLYLDNHLPRYARGSQLWFIIMTAGTMAYLLIALLRESVFLDTGLPLVQNLLGLLILLYLIIRSGLINRVLDRDETSADTLIFISLFSVLAIYGARSSIIINSLPISFGTLIPIISGLLGGPIAGIGVGFVTGLGTYEAPGFESLPFYVSFFPPLFAGLMAGVCSYLQAGKVSYRRTLFIGLFAGMAQLALLWMNRPSSGSEDIIEELHQITIPTIGTLLLGLVIILYLIDEERKTRRHPTSAESDKYRLSDATEKVRSQLRISEVLTLKRIIILIISFIVVRMILFSPLSETGFPLFSHVAVLGAIIFLLTRSRTFQDILIGATTMTEKIWLVVVFGLFSVYGQYGAIEAGAMTIPFPDLGPVIAGILGGPIIGACTGAIGGSYALIMGDSAGVPGALTTIISGILPGLCILRWRRRLTYLRVILIGILVGVLRTAVSLHGGGAADGSMTEATIVTFLIPILGLILFQFIIREETVSFLSICKTGNTVLDKNHETRMATLSQDTMTRLNGLFTIISGRLLSLEFIMSQIGEEEIARKIRILVRTDLIDDLLEDFSQFSMLHREGNRDDLQLALKAGQITRKLDLMIHKEGLNRIIHPSLIRRTDRLYHDYLSLLEGMEPAPGKDRIELSPFISEIIHENTRKPATDEEFLDACDDPERYLQLLITRIAHISLFDQVVISYTQLGDLTPICTTTDRLEDVIISLLEGLGASGAKTIEITGQQREGAVLLSLKSRGTGQSWPPAFGGMAALTEECRLSRGEISHETEGNLFVITIVLTPWAIQPVSGSDTPSI